LAILVLVLGLMRLLEDEFGVPALLLSLLLLSLLLLLFLLLWMDGVTTESPKRLPLMFLPI
jgi:hypothetical protein